MDESTPATNKLVLLLNAAKINGSELVPSVGENSGARINESTQLHVESPEKVIEHLIEDEIEVE